MERRETSKVPPTKIVYDDLEFITFLVETICDGSCCGLIDDTEYLKASDHLVA
jgi:hypothetical protein